MIEDSLNFTVTLFMLTYPFQDNSLSNNRFGK